jgi:hypothetical protein
VFLFFGTSLLVALAAVAVGARLYPGRRAELALATGSAWLGIVFSTVGVLGWGNSLTRRNLALLAAVASLALLVASLAPNFRERGVASLRALRSLAALPLGALRACVAERSVALAGVVATLVLLPYLAWLGYFAPSCSWDGTWYHEMIVGLAIQERGFGEARLPEHLELVNGYPRGGEHFAIWFALLGDRRLIDVPQTAAAPLLLVAFYVLARRVGASTASALGYAAVMLLVPGYLLQLRSTYVDATVVTLYLAAGAFATRPELRGRELIFCGLCLGMVAASKQTGVVMAALLGALALIRGLTSLRGKPRRDRTRTALALLAGSALLFALGAPIYLRNWVLHQNPVWPVTYALPVLGVRFDGPSIDPVRGLSAIGTLATIFLPPKPGTQFSDIRDGGYGLAVPWIAVPLAALALLVALFRLAAGKREGRALHDPTLCLLAFVIPTLLTLPLSPALWWARFNLQAPAAILLLAAWLFRRRRWIGQAALGALLAVGLLSLLLYSPKWEIGFAQTLALMKRSPLERAAFRSRGWNMPEPTALARERELGPGDVLAYTSDVAFPGTFWNERFDNRVLYVGAGFRELIPALEAARAKWVVVPMGGPHERVLHHSAFYERIGQASQSDAVYRRRARPLLKLAR